MNTSAKLSSWTRADMAELGQGSKTGPEPAPAPAPAVAPSPYSPALKELLHDLEQQSLMNLEQCTDRLVQQIYQGAEGIKQKIRCSGLRENPLQHQLLMAATIVVGKDTTRRNARSGRRPCRQFLQFQQL